MKGAGAQLLLLRPNFWVNAQHLSKQRQHCPHQSRTLALWLLSHKASSQVLGTASGRQSHT